MDTTIADPSDGSGTTGQGVTSQVPQAQDGVKMIAALPQKPANFGPQYLDSGAWDIQGSEIDNADDLTASQWSKILRVNKALYGFTLREQEKDIVKARLQAFSLLKPSAVTSNENPDIIPDFEVWDPSSITIKETKTDLQRSLAINGFSSQSIEAALGGGDFGVSAGISAILKAERSTGDANMVAAATKEYYAAYNFPRARLFLDEFTLQVSPDCQRALRDLRKEPSDEKLRKFSERFGHVFATVFQLGGQLQSSKFATSLLSEDESEKRDALKAAVGATFAAQYVSASAKYSKDTVRSTQNTEQKIADLSGLAWTARGGNTLLSANPPQWATTLASHKNWRIIEQEKVFTLHQLIGQLEGWEDIPELFEQIARKQIQSISQRAPPPKWSGRIKLILETSVAKSYKLFWNRLDSSTLAPALTADDDKEMEPIFHVLNANRAETVGYPTLTSLPTDYPIFLVSGHHPVLLSGKRNIYPGVYVDSTGKLKPGGDNSQTVCRFSLRLAKDYGPWRRHDTQPQIRINSGDRVSLYCHSLGLGPYANIERPPISASPVVYNEIEQTVGVSLIGHPGNGAAQYIFRSYATNAEVQPIIQQYDLGTLSSQDREAFEKKGHLVATDRVGKIKPLETPKFPLVIMPNVVSGTIGIGGVSSSTSGRSGVKDGRQTSIMEESGFIPSTAIRAMRQERNRFQNTLIGVPVAEFTILFV